MYLFRCGGRCYLERWREMYDSFSSLNLVETIIAVFQKKRTTSAHGVSLFFLKLITTDGISSGWRCRSTCCGVPPWRNRKQNKQSRQKTSLNESYNKKNKNNIVFTSLEEWAMLILKPPVQKWLDQAIEADQETKERWSRCKQKKKGWLSV